MIHSKTVITGRVARVSGDLIYIKRSDGGLDCYNSKYYRVVE